MGTRCVIWHHRPPLSGLWVSGSAGTGEQLQQHAPTHSSLRHFARRGDGPTAVCRGSCLRAVDRRVEKIDLRIFYLYVLALFVATCSAGLFQWKVIRVLLDCATWIFDTGQRQFKVVQAWVNADKRVVPPCLPRVSGTHRFTAECVPFSAMRAYMKGFEVSTLESGVSLVESLCADNVPSPRFSSPDTHHLHRARVVLQKRRLQR